MASRARILGRRLLLAADLFETGVAMKRQYFRRRFPDASDEELDRYVAAWLAQHRGAEHGDGVGRVITWPRR